LIIVVAVVLLSTGATTALGDDAPPASPIPVPPSTAEPSSSAPAAPSTTAARPHQQDAAAVGKALSNPMSDVWALFTEFDFAFNEGDIPGGDGKVTYQTIFEPVMPIKFQLGGEYSVVNEDLYGKRWLIKLNVIPVIPDLIRKPVFGS
jgi:hypothetical protein